MLHVTVAKNGKAAATEPAALSINVNELRCQVPNKGLRHGQSDRCCTAQHVLHSTLFLTLNVNWCEQFYQPDARETWAMFGIGVVGGGYMGKAHAVAMAAVGAVFDTRLRPSLEIVCTTTEKGAAEKAKAFGFVRSTSDWRKLVDDRNGAGRGDCQSPGYSLENRARCICQSQTCLLRKTFGTKSIRKSQNARSSRKIRLHSHGRFQLHPLARLATGPADHCRRRNWRHHLFPGARRQKFLADPELPATWRTKGRANGDMGDLAPHIINAACALIGPIASVSAEIETVHKLRPTPTGSEAVTNDDHAHITCRFESGTLGSLYISRIATGRKMGYAYEMFGTKGAIRFDQEDQNALWLYKGDAAANRQGFTKILTGPQHPDYVAFCLGPGHGTGYQDQIIIEARDFLEAIADGKTRWPSFRDGMIVNQIIEAAWKSQDERRWVDVSSV